MTSLCRFQLWKNLIDIYSFSLENDPGREILFTEINSYLKVISKYLKWYFRHINQGKSYAFQKLERGHTKQLAGTVPHSSDLLTGSAGLFGFVSTSFPGLVSFSTKGNHRILGAVKKKSESEVAQSV